MIYIYIPIYTKEGSLSMGREISIREWVERFNDGKYDSRDVQTQIEADWNDWFCRDSSLANKTKRMGNIIKQIKPGGKIDLESSYVWFKNNRPLDGPLYDDFRIVDINSNSTLFVVQIGNLQNNFRYALFSRLNGFKTVIIEFNSMRELVKWFSDK